MKSVAKPPALETDPIPHIEGPLFTASPRRQIPVIKPKKVSTKRQPNHISSGNTSQNVMDMQVTSYGISSSAAGSAFMASAGMRSNA